MKVSRKRPQADVPHPVHPEVVFTLEKPDAFDIAELSLMFDRYERRIQVVDAEQKPVMVEKDGVLQALTERQSSIPAMAIVRASAAYVKKITGLEDEDGKPIVYGGSIEDRVATLRLLADDFLVPLAVPRPVMVNGKAKLDPKSGEPVPPVTQLTCHQWLMETGGNRETYGISSGKG